MKKNELYNAKQTIDFAIVQCYNNKTKIECALSEYVL